MVNHVYRVGDVLTVIFSLYCVVLLCGLGRKDLAFWEVDGMDLFRIWAASGQDTLSSLIRSSAILHF